MNGWIWYEPGLARGTMRRANQSLAENYRGLGSKTVVKIKTTLEQATKGTDIKKKVARVQEKNPISSGSRETNVHTRVNPLGREVA
jgi:hypothetical protein